MYITIGTRWSKQEQKSTLLMLQKQNPTFQRNWIQNRDSLNDIHSLMYHSNLSSFVGFFNFLMKYFTTQSLSLDITKFSLVFCLYQGMTMCTRWYIQAAIKLIAHNVGFDYKEFTEGKNVHVLSNHECQNETSKRVFKCWQIIWYEKERKMCRWQVKSY
jgi:hypothetical protein